MVSYFSHKPIEGTKEFVAEYDGVPFKFSSVNNLNLFKKNPEKYVPQYGGYCAYAMGTNTLELWQNEGVALLMEKADENWKTIKYK